MNAATQLFMLTPTCEWLNDNNPDKGETLFLSICRAMEEGELSSMTWEQTLRAEPTITTPSQLKSLCYDVWEFELERIQEILGNCDIDWQYVAEEYLRYIVVQCMAQEDEAIEELARQAREEESAFESFKKEVDAIFSAPCNMGMGRIRQMKEYQEKQIKERQKRIDYIELQIEKQQS
jgi:hypothetical protein